MSSGRKTSEIGPTSVSRSNHAEVSVTATTRSAISSPGLIFIRTLHSDWLGVAERHSAASKIDARCGMSKLLVVCPVQLPEFQETSLAAANQNFGAVVRNPHLGCAFDFLSIQGNDDPRQMVEYRHIASSIGHNYQ